MSRLQRRRWLVGAAALLALPRRGAAQAPPRTLRIGVLLAPSAADFRARTDALRAGLRELGYSEDRQVEIVVRSAEGRFDQLPALAADLARQEVDVIVVAGTPAIRAARQSTSTIPIVIAAVGDAVAGGHVASLSRPGANVTGSTYFAREIAAKQLELLKAAFPREGRVAVLFNPGNPASGPTLQTLAGSSRSLRLETEEFAVRGPSDFEAAWAAIAGKRHRMALVVDDPMTIAHARSLAELAMKHRVASGANFIEYAEAGGLMSYGVDLVAMWRRAAWFVDRIVKGTAPGEIAVERATRFELVINRQTAVALKLELPASVLVRADRVIG